MNVNTPVVYIIKKYFVIHRKAKYCINMLCYSFSSKKKKNKNKKGNISQTRQYLLGTNQFKENGNYKEHNFR